MNKPLAYSDIGTQLLHAPIVDDAIPTTGFTALVPVKSTSDKGAEPETITTTTLDLKKESNVPGRVGTPTQTYTLNNTPEHGEALNAIVGKRHAFLEVYSDGTSVLMIGVANTYINGVTLNSPRERVLSIVCEDIIEKTVAETTALKEVSGA